MTFTNGDRLTGTVIEATEKEVRLRTDATGVVTIPWAAVAGLSTGTDVELVLADDRTVRGQLQFTNGAGTVKTASGNVAVLVKDIRAIHAKSPDSGPPAVADAEPPPWGGDADAGLTLTRGNADTMIIDLSSHVTRQTDRDRLALYLASLFANANTTIGESVTTARSVRGGGRYDHDLVGPAFAFGMADLESDKFQFLNLRAVIGAGFGWHVAKTDDRQMNLFGGLSYAREDFSVPGRKASLIRTEVEAVFGEDAFAPIGEGGSFTEQVIVHISPSGERRIAAEASFTLPLKGMLNFRISLSDSYVSNPLPGVKSNDLQVTSGLNLTFGRENVGSYEGGNRPSSNPADASGPKTAPKRTPVKR